MSGYPPTPRSLVFVELLADHKGSLAALHWTQGPGTAAGLTFWLESPGFVRLAQAIPCLWAETAVEAWPEGLRECLQQSGGATVAATAVTQCTDGPSHPKPDQALWVAGPWYLQPPPRPSASQAASRALVLQLVQLVAADAETCELEAVFRQNATLAYHLLRIVNSPVFGRSRPITSFPQAILLLGREPLKRWLNLMLFATQSDDQRSGMLLAHVTLRARGTELLAHRIGLTKADQDQAFMAGMFSMLGILFGLELEDVLRPLKLSDEMTAALLRNEGPLGLLLQTWMAVEQADAGTVTSALQNWDLPPAMVSEVLIEACNWMLDITHRAGHSSG